MRLLTDPKAVASVASIVDAELRALLKQRFQAMSQYQGRSDPEAGYFVIVDSDDTPETLEQVTGCPINHGWFDDALYGDEDFVPAWEWLAEHASYFEMVFILSEATIVLLIAKHANINPLLLKLCQSYAIALPILMSE